VRIPDPLGEPRSIDSTAMVRLRPMPERSRNAAAPIHEGRAREELAGIGRAIVKALLEKNYDVMSLDAALTSHVARELLQLCQRRRLPVM
jgi:hypothetical protein